MQGFMKNRFPGIRYGRLKTRQDVQKVWTQRFHLDFSNSFSGYSLRYHSIVNLTTLL